MRTIARSSTRARVLLALIPPLIALVILWAGWDLVHPYAWVLFVPAVTFSAWIAVLVDRSIRADARLRRMSDETRIFAALIDNSSDFIGIADPTGTPVYVNPAGRRMVELPPSTPLETTQISDYYPSDQRAFVEDVIVKRTIKEGHWQGETFFRNWRTGAAIPVSDTHFLIRDPDTGTLLGMGTVTRDSSDVQHAREEVEAANPRLRSLFESAPDGVFIADAEGRYTDVNDAGCRIIGYSRDELIGKSIVDVIRPEDVARLEADRQELLGGAAVVGEWWLRRKDGSYVPVEVSAKILSDGRWQAFVRDITRRKRLQAEVHQAQERIELALNGADLAAWDWNIETGEVLFNERWAEMRGYSTADLVPNVETWNSGIHPDDLPRVQQALNDHFAGRTTEYECEFRVQTKSGSWIWILDRGKVFGRNAQGEPTRMLGTVLDITTRKRADIELRRVEHEQRFLAEVGAVLASSLDYEQTLDRVAELAVHEIADLCVVDLVSPEGEIRRLKVVCRDPDQQSIADGLMRVSLEKGRTSLTIQALSTQEPLLIERVTDETLVSYAQSDEHLNLLRELAPTSMIAVPLFAHGKALGAIALASTSSRRLSRADLRLAQELARRAALAIESARLYAVAQRAIQARDNVLGVVAHDLRNPLNTINLQAEMLLEGGGRDRKVGEGILRSVMRMNRLIQDILDVTRLDAGQLTVERRRLSTIQVLLDVVEAQRPLADAKGIALLVEIEPDLPDVWADRDRLLQICENLIGNALKFTKHGSVTLGATAHDGEVLIWVKDTGIGLAAETLPHLFDRFWQASADNRSQGAGLGLPIVKGLVEAHGGRVWAESTPGSGSCFYFTLPVAPQSEAWPSAPTAARP